MQDVEIAPFFSPDRLNLFKVLTRHGFYRIDQELEPILHNLDQIIPADKYLGQLLLPVSRGNVLLQYPFCDPFLNVAFDVPDQRRYAQTGMIGPPIHLLIV